MAVLTTGDLTIPTSVFTPWVKKIHEGSAIMQLTPGEPMKFGKGEAFTFDTGEAEYVGEGQNKGASDVTSSVQRIEPFKFHKTLRWTEEVMWADEDHQLGVVQELLNQIQPALSRALDFGVIHGINPTGGAPVSAMTQTLTATTNEVEFDASAQNPHDATDDATAAILGAGGVPNGLAADPEFAAKIVGVRDKDGRKLYPDFSFTEGSTFESLSTAVSRTVGAKGVAATDTNLLAIQGDFSAVRWGIQKAIGLEVIQYGDPDGQGDLKRNNQVAFRAEVVYGWGIADVNRNFAKIVKTGAGSGE